MMMQKKRFAPRTRDQRRIEGFSCLWLLSLLATDWDDEQLVRAWDVWQQTNDLMLDMFPGRDFRSDDGKTIVHVFFPLLNCNDPLPASCCDQLDLPEGSTYAQAVRKLKADIPEVEFIEALQRFHQERMEELERIRKEELERGQ
jgi:hypothetical protein